MTRVLFWVGYMFVLTPGLWIGLPTFAEAHVLGRSFGGVRQQIGWRNDLFRRGLGDLKRHDIAVAGRQLV